MPNTARYAGNRISLCKIVLVEIVLLFTALTVLPTLQGVCRTPVQETESSFQRRAVRLKKWQLGSVTSSLPRHGCPASLEQCDIR